MKALLTAALLALVGAGTIHAPRHEHPGPPAGLAGYTTCATVSADDPNDAGPVTPIPALTTHKAVTVDIRFFDTYGDGSPIVWTDLEKQYICAAARRFATAWSSEEFYQKLQHLPKLILSGRMFTKKISGPDLYNQLTSHPIVMNLALSDSPKLTCAATTPGPDQTVIVTRYIDRQPGTEACENDRRGTSLVEDLTDTLSHEFTHYKVSMKSKDMDVVDDRGYVSYGIGCLTENIAVPGDTCSFDPSRP